MKPIGLLLLAGIFVVSAVPIASAADESPVVARRSGKPLTGGPVLARGDTVETVLELIGKPAATPAPDVWVYWNYNVNLENVDPKFDTLLVFFEHGQVTELRLVEGRIIRKLLARLEAEDARKGK